MHALVLFTGGSFPKATLFINIAGSFLIGLLFALAVRKSISNELWLLAGNRHLRRIYYLFRIQPGKYAIAENRKLCHWQQYIF
jgi:hypothetical protein